MSSKAIFAQQRNVVGKLLRDGAPLTQKDEEAFDEFFKTFIFPPFSDPKASIPEQREQLRVYFRTGKQGPAYERLNTLVLELAKQLYSNKNAVVRSNAVLTLGDLNAHEASVAKPAMPLPEALKVLLGIVKDPKQPDFLRVTAMIGIERHAEANDTYPLEPETRTAISKLMFEALTQAKPPADRTPSAHAWVRRMAASTLAAFGSPGPTQDGADAAYVKAILGIINDPQTPPSTRIALAATLGRFQYPAKMNVAPASIAGAIGFVALDTAQAEMARIRKLDEESETREIFDPNLRLLQYVFKSARIGMFGPDERNDANGGVVSVAGSDAKIRAIADDILKISKLVDLKDPTQVDPAAIESSLEEFASTLGDRDKLIGRAGDVAKLPVERAAGK